MRKMMVKTVSMLVKTRTRAATSQQGGMRSESSASQASHTHPKVSSVSSRAQLISTTCPAASPLQLRKAGAVGQAAATVPSSGRSNSSVMVVTKMHPRMRVSKRGCCATAAHASRTGLFLVRKPKELWAGMLSGFFRYLTSTRWSSGSFSSSTCPVRSLTSHWRPPSGGRALRPLTRVAFFFHIRALNFAIGPDGWALRRWKASCPGGMSAKF
mmetsp:Transcript_57867/g.135881  ORF Transcript_57867/g.135881 Transcript_57867/m.135881 type:complete len:213 (-) Transcript_57867:512-1150(-)